MLLIDSASGDPRFNLAAEEYMLKDFSEEVAFFYINTRSVIIGKHQNAWAEVNKQFARQYKVPVFRRFSGGGTVFHDDGNLNFSFFRNGEPGKLVDFRKYSRPILDFLTGLGLDANYGERNEILAGGKKISGTAEHVHRNRVLHHGTLLFSSDLESLTGILKVDPTKYTGKAVRSIRSEVTNISSCMKDIIPVSLFRKLLLEHIIQTETSVSRYEFSPVDIERIEVLIREKYGNWEWNIAYSPAYILDRSFELNSESWRIHLKVIRGIITDASMEIGGISFECKTKLEKSLLNIRHKSSDIRNSLLNLSGQCIDEKWVSGFVENLF